MRTRLIANTAFISCCVPSSHFAKRLGDPACRGGSRMAWVLSNELLGLSRRRCEPSYGHLEKLLPLAIADSSGVNVNESERERSGIIRGQFYGVWRGGAIFRGAHKADDPSGRACKARPWNSKPHRQKTSLT